jgi:hypothetical protein
MGYADPAARLGYGYVTTRMGMHLQGDPRDVALRNAIPEPLRRTLTVLPPMAADTVSRT